MGMSVCILLYGGSLIAYVCVCVCIFEKVYFFKLGFVYVVVGVGFIGCFVLDGVVAVGGDRVIGEFWMFL